MEPWLQSVRTHVAQHAPEILALLDTYAGEARHGRGYIAPDLRSLPSRVQVLEIGAGSLLLSCQLVREGYRVQALEPVSQGFSHFNRLQELVLECARAQACAPVLLRCSAEQLVLEDCVDYAFSINVMEHVDDVGSAIRRIARALRPGARYRFTCPNYLFPYEPHFHTLTLFSKSLTERFLGGRLFNRTDMPDPVGTWKSLNWITVPGVARLVDRVPGLESHFGRRLLVSTVERVATDPQFSARHAGWLRACLLVMMRLRLHRLLGWVPAIAQPIMDCVVTRRGMRGTI